MYNKFFSFLMEKDVKYKRNVNLSSHSYIKIGAIVDVAVFPNTTDKLVTTLRYLYTSSIPFFVVGNMSNLLPNDSNYNGVAVFTHELDKYSIDGSLLTVECGASLSRVIAELSLGGFEALFGIPGSVGGMIYSNAGAFGSEISDKLLSVTVYNIVNDAIYSLSKNELNFSYRYSWLKENKHIIILDAVFSLVSMNSAQVKEKIKAYMERRRASQPVGKPSLGSAFKRCSSSPVSRLIDECGLKGYRVGGAEISKKHAGFIINSGGASSEDYKNLVILIKDKLFQRYGIRIEEEIEYLDFLPYNIT